MQKPEELCAIIEALLFTAREPVTLQQLEKLLETACAPAEVRHHLATLQGKYPSEGASSGVSLVEVAGGWRLYTHPATEPWVKQFITLNNVRSLSPAALETLAIIAYRQPVTLAEINEIRGVESSGVIRTLLEKRIARMTGRKNVAGKPILYGTGPEFLTHFGLATLEDLPSLAEFETLFGGEAKQALLFESPEAPAAAPDETEPFEEDDSAEMGDESSESQSAPESPAAQDGE
jgi:segregation and condensation protein B